MSFRCNDAHHHLGLAKASVEKCTELLVDFHRVTLLDGEPRQRLVKTLVWEGNGPVREKGLGALTRYLARTQGFERKLDATALGQLIAHFDAAPAGFDPTTLGDTLTPVERRATVSFSPLTVTLFSVGWTPPQKVADPMAGLPPGAMLMPGGPPCALSAPLALPVGHRSGPRRRPLPHRQAPRSRRSRAPS